MRQVKKYLYLSETNTKDGLEIKTFWEISQPSEFHLLDEIEQNLAMVGFVELLLKVLVLDDVWVSSEFPDSNVLQLFGVELGSQDQHVGHGLVADVLHLHLGKIPGHGQVRVVTL